MRRGGQAASTFPSMNREGIIEEIKHEFRAARHVTDEAEVRRVDALTHTSLASPAMPWISTLPGSKPSDDASPKP